MPSAAKWNCFNPRLREGGDYSRRKVRQPNSRFNPRLREGGDVQPITPFQNIEVSIHASAREATSNSSCRLISESKFQSTPPRGRRLPTMANKMVNRSVSIHASAREATGQTPSFPAPVRCFNPRLREGGDHSQNLLLFHSTVSIHASAREATSPLFCYGRNGFVSIHASAREATLPDCQPYKI